MATTNDDVTTNRKNKKNKMATGSKPTRGGIKKATSDEDKSSTASGDSSMGRYPDLPVSDV